jgi:hypothetical protein
LSTGIRILLYIMSLLIPIAGFIVGAIYYTKPEPEYKHVGKMCIIFGIVSIIVTFGLAALLYAMVLGFGGEYIETPAATYSKSSVTGGWRITIIGITKSDVPWSNVRVHLTDGSDFAEWRPLTTDLDNSPGITVSYTARPLGTISVALNITDLAGNGFVNGGDFFQVVSDTGFLPSVVYRAVLIFEPSGEQIGTGISFTG